MFAAVVRQFDRPPRYEEIPDPQPAGEDDVLVDVLAAALHPRVRSSADGSHYESTGELPLVPGVDGVGRTPDGALVYFVLPDTLDGSMAERVVADRRRCAVLPADVDPVAIAAVMNPAMSSWVALRRRVTFTPGSSVLVLGATGGAGRMAVQIAKHLGAGRVVGAGRDPQRLAELTGLGADAAVTLDPDAIAAEAADTDVVIDYLWGDVTERVLPAILHGRSDRGRPLDWIEIGSMAGLELTVRSEWLRAARLQIVGSGQGSVPTTEIVAELTELAAEIARGGYAIDAEAVPLSEVERAWETSASSPRRVVFTPACRKLPLGGTF